MNLEKDFTEIYTAHAPKVYRVCLGYASGNEDLAREWVQQTFIRIWNHRASFKGEAAVGTWIYRIAVNVCLNDLRRNKKKYLPLHENMLADETVHNHQRDREGQISKMYQCINQLTEQNKVLILMELEEIPQSTIAQTTGLAYGSVRTRLSRIRKSLLKCMTHEK